MIRVTEDALSEEGFPFVYWEQGVPTGKSAYSLQQAAEIKIAAVVMVFVFAAVWSWSEQFWGGVFAALIVGGMCLAGDKMFRGGVKVWDIHIPGPEPRDTAEADRRAKATAILGRQYRGLVVGPQEGTDELLLWVMHGSDPDSMEWSRWVPLTSVQSLELGTADEWFEGISRAELRRVVSAPNSWVIVAPTLGHGVLWIAESGGAKAGIASLHGLLTKRFVIDAPEILQRWKEELEEREARTITIPAAPAAEGRDAGGAGNQEQGKRAEALSGPAAGEGGDAADAQTREK